MTKQDLDNFYNDKKAFEYVSNFAKSYAKNDEDLWLFLIDRAYEKTLVWIQNGGEVTNSKNGLRGIICNAIKGAFIEGAVRNSNGVYNSKHLHSVNHPITLTIGDHVFVEDILEDVVTMDEPSEFLDVVLEIAESCHVKDARALIEDRYVYGHPIKVMANNHKIGESLTKARIWETINYIRKELNDSGIKKENLYDIFDLSRIEHKPNTTFKPVGRMQKV